METKNATNQKNSNSKIIKESKKTVSDADLLKDLSDFNVENLIAKTAKGRSIWKKDYLLTIADNEKTARRRVRNMQLALSKTLLHAILTKESANVIKERSNALKSFYNKALVDFNIYSNVSEKENVEKFKTLKFAYEKMKLIN